MATKNRETLKKYFQKGRRPTVEQFGDLIDSMLNMIDEGFDKTLEDGLRISSIGESGKQISFYRNYDHEIPAWSIKIESSGSSEKFTLCNQREEKILALDPDGKVGVNKKKPEFSLDVEGVIASQGRTGGLRGKVPADGKWQRITKELEGCRAFEIMAGVGKQGTGKYALLHAFAMNTFNPGGFFFNFLKRKKKIAANHAYYKSKCDKIKLRWKKVGTSQSYYLEVRTNSNYGDDVEIQYNITELWFDHFMKGCVKSGPRSVIF